MTRYITDTTGLEGGDTLRVYRHPDDGAAICGEVVTVTAPSDQIAIAAITRALYSLGVPFVGDVRVELLDSAATVQDKGQLGWPEGVDELLDTPGEVPWYLWRWAISSSGLTLQETADALGVARSTVAKHSALGSPRGSWALWWTLVRRHVGWDRVG